MRNRKKERLTASQRLSNISNIPIDMVLTRLPYITLCSNREITVEDAGKLIHYDTENVKVMQGRIAVCVTGRNLVLRCLANNDMRVEGYIISVNFEQV